MGRFATLPPFNPIVVLVLVTGNTHGAWLKHSALTGQRPLSPDHQDLAIRNHCLDSSFCGDLAIYHRLAGEAADGAAGAF